MVRKAYTSKPGFELGGILFFKKRCCLKMKFAEKKFFFCLLITGFGGWADG
jgi:hypothetical protein